LIKRRQVMIAGLGAALPWGARAGTGLTLLVAGPAGETTDRWAQACALALSPGLAGAPIATVPVGGLDGVTGGNRLDALVVPDGRTAAILPGEALIAWLTGDPRVHFDPTRWVPVMAAVGSGVLLARLPDGAPVSLTALRAAQPLRLAADEPQSRDLAVLLALGRLGIASTPIFGLRDVAAKSRAFLSGEADAVFIAGEGVPEDMAALIAAGGRPCFRLGAPAGDTVLPGVPDVTAFGGASALPMGAAYGAAAMASMLDFIVVLPKLTDPLQVTAWQRAAASAVTMPALASAAAASAVTLGDAGAAGAALRAVRLGQADQRGLQAYLAKNFGWQPG
jgi:hypothetical protein